MKKYYLIARNMWDQMTTYRLSFLVWRIRQIIRLFTLYFLWDAILGKSQILFGYSRAQMLTYILLGFFIDAVVFSTQSVALADDINNGDLSNFLLRPMNYFFYWAAKDIGDKLLSIFFFIIEFALFIVIFHPPFSIQTNSILIILFFLSIAIGTTLFFFCSILLGMIGFWSNEAWAPRFLFTILLNFLAGGLLPLNMLPAPLYAILKVLPFGYLYYFPARIYLGQASNLDIFFGLSISVLWIGILFLFARYVWTRGLKIYTAQGR